MDVTRAAPKDASPSLASRSRPTRTPSHDQGQPYTCSETRLLAPVAFPLTLLALVSCISGRVTAGDRGSLAPFGTEPHIYRRDETG